MFYVNILFILVKNDCYIIHVSTCFLNSCHTKNKTDFNVYVRELQ